MAIIPYLDPVYQVVRSPITLPSWLLPVRPAKKNKSSNVMFPTSAMFQQKFSKDNLAKVMFYLFQYSHIS